MSYLPGFSPSSFALRGADPLRALFPSSFWSGAPLEAVSASTPYAVAASLIKCPTFDESLRLRVNETDGQEPSDGF